MATAILGYNTVFQTGDGNSPETFTSFIECTSIVPPEARVDTVDTSHEMPPMATRESFPGLMDWGEVTITFNFVPGNASALALITEAQSNLTLNRKILWPNGRVISFAAYLTSYKAMQVPGDKLSGSATFKVTSFPTFA